MMIEIATLLMGLALAPFADAPECGSPPPRTSDSYWGYIDACGCAKLDPPARASLDYDRFLKACSAWRQRNAQRPTGRPERPARGCETPPPRGSDAYWDFVDTCGCSKLDTPSRASADYERFLKACGQWRSAEPENEASPASTPGPGTKPKPTPSPSPSTAP